MATTPPAIYPIQSLNRLSRMLGMDRAQLADLAKEAGAHYRSFDIQKVKDDGRIKWRHIDNPDDEIDPIHKAIYRKLLKPVAQNMPDYLTGGMPGKSIKDNAFPHLGQPAIVTLDIQNCFPSINHRRIFKVWREELGVSDDVASILTKLTTLQNRLPQGSTASPILCNLALANLSAEINEYAVQNGLAFTQYVDDIALSGDPTEVRGAIEVMIPLVRRHGYALGHGKIVIMDGNELQKTTGLKVNTELTLPRHKLEAMRNEIMRLHNLGNCAKTYELNTLWGKLYFYMSINPERGKALFNLASTKLTGLSGTYAEKPKDVTRPCRDYGNKH